MRINMSNALREWVYHGEEKYLHYQKSYNQFLRVVRLAPLLESYEDAALVMLAFKHE